MNGILPLLYTCIALGSTALIVGNFLSNGVVTERNSGEVGNSMSCWSLSNIFRIDKPHLFFKRNQADMALDILLSPVFISIKAWTLSKSGQSDDLYGVVRSLVR